MMFGIYIGNDTMLVKTTYGGLLSISAKDRSLMPTLVTTGAIEHPLTQYFRKQIRPGQTIVDIGANIGYFTILAAQLVGEQGKVIGLEANPSVYTYVKDNVQMNWVTPQTELHNLAAYSDKTSINFFVSSTYQGDSSINSNLDVELEEIEVNTITIDELLQSVKKVDLLKIDIEGGEYHAFLGMKQSIVDKKIRAIAFEWNPKMLGEEYTSKFAELLHEYESTYKGQFYLLSHDGIPILTEAKHITDQPSYPFGLIYFPHH